MRLASKVLALCSLILGSTSCAATPDAKQPLNESILLNSNQSNIREAIRVFVRKDAGRLVKADPDSLAHSSRMIVHRRASDFQSEIRRLPVANINYTLVSDGKNCWLVRHETTVDSPIAAELLLPNSAQCRFVNN